MRRPTVRASEQVKLCRDGHFFEPKIAELIFREMLAGEKNVRLIARHRVVAARVVDADGKERDADPWPADRGRDAEGFRLRR